MLYLTVKEKSKATTKPWLSRLPRHPAMTQSGSILGHNTHTHIDLLSPNPHGDLMALN